MGQLTTHVLDTMSGTPAAGIEIELWHARAGGWEHVTTIATNADGRSDHPLLGPEDMRAGRYELRFRAGDYLRRCGAPLSDPPFLDVVPVRFAIADASASYHVPLLLSPFGYSTYRGS